MSKLDEIPLSTDAEVSATSEGQTRFVMERRGKLQDLDRSFDIEFWQRQGTAAILSSAWELAELYHTNKGKSPDELRLQRTIEDFQRLSG